MVEEKRGDMLHLGTLRRCHGRELASTSRLVAHMQQALALSVRADDGFHPDLAVTPACSSSQHGTAPRHTGRVVSCSRLQLVTPESTRPDAILPLLDLRFTGTTALHSIPYCPTSIAPRLWHEANLTLR